MLVEIRTEFSAGTGYEQCPSSQSAATRFTAYISSSPNRVFLKKAFEGLEPDVPKGPSPVLRGLGPSNGARLLGPTIRFQVLYVFLVLAHDRRRVLHFHVTAHPTAEWTGQQLREAFPFDQVPRYLLRDRDAIFGREFSKQVTNMGIQEVLSTPRSPWQRAYIERVIGSIRRECLDHLIVFHESSLRRTLASYFDYYHRSRTHLSLDKDSPEPRPIQAPEMGRVVAVPTPPLRTTGRLKTPSSTLLVRDDPLNLVLK